MAASSQTPPSARLEEVLSISNRIEELSEADDNDEYEDMGVVTGQQEDANIAYLNSVTIPIRDSLVTTTSKAHDETFDAIMPFLEGNPHDFPLNMFGVPMLQRDKHIKYLESVIGDDYPAPFAVMDASRPWFVYWSLQGLTALGEDVSSWRDR